MGVGVGLHNQTHYNIRKTLTCPSKNRIPRKLLYYYCFRQGGSSWSDINGHRGWAANGKCIQTHGLFLTLREGAFSRGEDPQQGLCSYLSCTLEVVPFLNEEGALICMIHRHHVQCVGKFSSFFARVPKCNASSNSRTGIIVI